MYKFRLQQWKVSKNRRNDYSAATSRLSSRHKRDTDCIEGITCKPVIRSRKPIRHATRRLKDGYESSRIRLFKDFSLILQGRGAVPATPKQD